MHVTLFIVKVLGYMMSAFVTLHLTQAFDIECSLTLHTPNLLNKLLDLYSCFVDFVIIHVIKIIRADLEG